MPVYTFGHVFGNKAGETTDGKLTIIQTQPYDMPGAYVVSRTSALRQIGQEELSEMMLSELSALIKRYSWLGLEQTAIENNLYGAFENVDAYAAIDVTR